MCYWLHLGLKNFNEVSLACRSLSDKWEKLAQHLSIDKSIVESIRARKDAGSAMLCLNELISIWLSHEDHVSHQPTWKVLCDAASKIDKTLSEKLWANHVNKGITMFRHRVYKAYTLELLNNKTFGPAISCFH